MRNSSGHRMAVRFVLIWAIILAPFFVQAQTKGSLQLNQDPKVDAILDKHIRILEANNAIDGFRIQIFMEAGNDAVAHADSVLASYHEAFPDIPAYLSFGQPYYRIRVGDFRNRLDAERALNIIRQKYSNAFVTAEKILPPKIDFSIPLDE